ncbi:DUF5325 family protein [Virgibacillus xinjiangensis]|uniref:DUF5325 family protein n=1 Tax=Virgibacillus xinjiangensis TaxID=393090 RepID=A0ABV7CV32_9BACI
MKKIDGRALLMAILVILMFLLVGFAIALRNIWLIVLFVIAGSAIMVYGIARKRKRK